MKKIKLSEEQDRLVKQMMLEMVSASTLQDKKDDVVVSKDVQNSGASLDQSLIDTANAAKANGINIADTDVSIEATGNLSGVGNATVRANPQPKESVIITKKQLNEVRLKKLKSNSQVIKVKNFLK